MKREIKFRVWDIQGKKMFIPKEIPNNSICCIPEDDDELFFVHMQYTGRKDIKEKEIYEGDIVLANGSESVLVHDASNARKFVSQSIEDVRRFEKRRSHYKVYWQENFAQFSFESLSEPKHSIESDINKRDIEVIGNIFETSELS